MPTQVPTLYPPALASQAPYSYLDPNSHVPYGYAQPANIPPNVAQVTLPTFGAFMGLRAPSPGQTLQMVIPQHIITLATTKASTEKEMLCLAYLNQLKGHQARDFLNFEFSPTLCKELFSPSGGIQDILLDWHKGLGPGVAMDRKRSEVAQLKRTFQTMATYAGEGVTVGSLASLAKLDTPVPTVPTSYNTFVDCLHRQYHIIARLLGPYCNYGQLVSAVSSTVMSETASIQNTDHWYFDNGPYILLALIKSAKEFFSQTRTMMDWPSLGPIVITTDINALALDIVRHAKHKYPPTELPPALQTVAAMSPSRQLQQPSLPRPPHNPATDPRQNTGGPPVTGGPPSRDRTNTVLRTNVKAPKVLVDFFATLHNTPDIDKYYCRSTSALKEAELDITAALQALGLDEADCFNFQARGSCNRRACNKPHVAKTIPAARATSLYTKLQPLLTSLKGKAKPSSSR